MSPEKVAPPFLSPENLAVDITPENLTVEARSLRPDVPKKADKPARLRLRLKRKYRGQQKKDSPRSNGKGRLFDDVP